MIALVLALLTLVAPAARAQNIVCDNVSSELRAFGLVQGRWWRSSDRPAIRSAIAGSTCWNQWRATS
jgi:hypothetical protein